MTLPPDGAPRQGIKDQVIYVAYWYPQMAVYDDVHRAFGPMSGWQVDPYRGNAEFYMGYGDYDVALTVPAGWLIGATGSLQNADEVLSQTTNDRLAEALRTGDVVRVVTADDLGPGRATAEGTDGKLTWRFKAEGVRDFAFGLSDQFRWDATIALTGDVNGNGQSDTTNIFAFYHLCLLWSRRGSVGSVCRVRPPFDRNPVSVVVAISLPPHDGHRWARLLWRNGIPHDDMHRRYSG